MTGLREIVDAVAQAIVPQLDRPFAFFGHSMGAIICFELARKLRRDRGLTPAHLFVSAHRAPQTACTRPTFHNLPDAEFVEKLRWLKGTPAEVFEHPELMRLLLPLLRRDFAAVEEYSYRHEPPFDSPISAFGGLQDQVVSRDEMQGWRAQTEGAFSLRMFPGEHFFIHTAETLLVGLLSHQLQKIAERLRVERAA